MGRWVAQHREVEADLTDEVWAWKRLAGYCIALPPALTL